MTHGSLFSGIRGFELAAKWMGWENIFSCEIDEFCNKVGKYRFPETIIHHDIRETDFTIYRNRIDILTGGFPCQPFSLAGKRKGKEDDRHLWPEMLRAIREIHPGWIVGENVFGIVNWSGGMVFDEVQASLEAEGYEVQPFILPACGVNAPHRRDRVWFVAHNNERSKRSSGTNRSIEENWSENNDEPEHGGKQAEQHNRSHELLQPFTNIGSEQFQERTQDGERQDREENGTGLDDRIKRFSNIWNVTDSDSERGCSGNIERENAIHANTCSEANGPGGLWEGFPTQSPLCSRNDGLSDRLAGTTFSKWRNESIKALGNSIVPQVVYQIFKAIELFDTSTMTISNQK